MARSNGLLAKGRAMARAKQGKEYCSRLTLAAAEAVVLLVELAKMAKSSDQPDRSSGLLIHLISRDEEEDQSNRSDKTCKQPPNQLPQTQIQGLEHG